MTEETLLDDLTDHLEIWSMAMPGRPAAVQLPSVVGLGNAMACSTRRCVLARRWSSSLGRLPSGPLTSIAF